MNVIWTLTKIRNQSVFLNRIPLFFSWFSSKSQMHIYDLFKVLQYIHNSKRVVQLHSIHLFERITNITWWWEYNILQKYKDDNMCVWRKSVISPYCTFIYLFDKWTYIWVWQQAQLNSLDQLHTPIGPQRCRRS